MNLSLKFPYRYRVMVLLYFLTFITYLDRVTISVVGVRIKNALHLTNAQFGLVLGSFALAYALFEIPSALLGDRIGQRKIFLRIVIWWSLFTAITGLMNGLTSLIFARFLFGMGESGSYPNGVGAVSRWFPKTESTKGFSWLSMGANSGAAIAPLFIVPIAIAFGWRAPFFLNAVIGMIWVGICYLWFKNHPSEMKHISINEKEYIENNRHFIEIRQPLPWNKLLRNVSFWALVISFFCSQWAGYFFIAWMPNYLQEGKHFTENEMKYTISYVFIFGILSAFLTGIWSDWLVAKRNVRFARRSTALVSFVAMALLTLLSASSIKHHVIIPSLVAAHFFLSPIIVTCFSTCIDIGGDRAGTLAGIMNFFGQMGAFFMSVIFGKIVDVTHSFESPQYVMVGIMVVGIICWLTIDASKKIIILQGKIQNSS